jgi:hypothetical protein
MLAKNLQQFMIKQSYATKQSLFPLTTLAGGGIGALINLAKGESILRGLGVGAGTGLGLGVGSSLGGGLGAALGGGAGALASQMSTGDVSTDILGGGVLGGGLLGGIGGGALGTIGGYRLSQLIANALESAAETQRDKKKERDAKKKES